MKIKKTDYEFDITLSIWDVLGQESFRKIHGMAFKGAKGAILVADITRKKTFENISDWARRVIKVTGEIPIVLIANKADLTSNYSFSESELEVLSQKLNAPYFLTSAKFGDNVIKSFFKLADMVSQEIIDELKG